MYFYFGGKYDQDISRIGVRNQLKFQTEAFNFDINALQAFRDDCMYKELSKMAK